MTQDLMETEKANAVYDILVQQAGAPESLRDVFLHSWPPDEFRFQGLLGFGGKFYHRRFKIDCYPEDLTPGRREIINEVNRLLDEVKK